MKIFLSILATAFTISIYWAYTQKPISESGAWLMSDPWGIVTVLDLYIGFFLMSIFMFLTVSNKSSLFLWIPLLMVLGNIISLIYLIFFYKKLTTMLGVNNENQ